MIGVNGRNRKSVSQITMQYCWFHCWNLIETTGWPAEKCKCRIYLPSATKTSSNCSASVTLVHLMRMRAGSVFSGSWWNLQGKVMEPPRCVTTLPGAVCTMTAPVSSSVGSQRTKTVINIMHLMTDVCNFYTCHQGLNCEWGRSDFPVKDNSWRCWKHWYILFNWMVNIAVYLPY